MAQVRHAGTGKWYFLDDDSTTLEKTDKAGTPLLGGDQQKASATKRPSSASKKGTKKRASQSSSQEHSRAPSPASQSQADSAAQDQRYKSTQVYMLVYRRPRLHEEQRGVQCQAPEEALQLVAKDNEELQARLDVRREVVEKRRQRILAQCQEIAGLSERLHDGTACGCGGEGSAGRTRVTDSEGREATAAKTEKWRGWE